MIDEDDGMAFTGMGMDTGEMLPLANADFSLRAIFKTKQAGFIAINLPESQMYNVECKALCVDPNGAVIFVSGENVLCRSFSHVNDNNWHEIAVVYSNEDKRYFTKSQENLIGCCSVFRDTCTSIYFVHMVALCASLFFNMFCVTG